jgi:hypothetical protein
LSELHEPFKTKTSNVDLHERKTMRDSNAEKNEAIVLEAVDTLFNKRVCTGAERFWSAASSSALPYFAASVLSGELAVSGEFVK